MKAFVPLCLLAMISWGCAGTQGVPGSVALRIVRGITTDEIRVTGYVARCPDGRQVNIDSARVQQIRRTMDLLLRDVPEGIYRIPWKDGPWNDAYSIEINTPSRRALYFLGCSDAVWSPPEPLLKMIELIEDSFPANEASRRQALGEIKTRLARKMVAFSELENMDLNSILWFIGEYADVPMNFGWNELKAYEVSPELLLHIKVEGEMTIEELLHRVLAGINAVSKTEIIASVGPDGVTIAPAGIAQGTKHLDGKSSISGALELAVFHVIHFGGGDLAQSIDGNGQVLYGRQRKEGWPEVGHYMRLEDLRGRVQSVLQTVPQGHYHCDMHPCDVVLEIPVKGGSKLYVLTPSATDPNMPEALNNLQCWMSGLSNW